MCKREHNIHTILYQIYRIDVHRGKNDELAAAHEALRKIVADKHADGRERLPRLNVVHASSL